MVRAKNISRASSGVSTIGHRLMSRLVLRNLSGWRLKKRRVVARTPAGGTEAIRTAPGAEWLSRYFWTTRPPIEWPITTGASGIAAAASATSVTYSAIRVQRSRSRPRAPPWPRRSIALTDQPRSAK
jgi:hypothetical protein